MIGAINSANSYGLSKYGYNGVGSIGGMDNLAAVNNAKLYEALTGKSSGVRPGSSASNSAQNTAAKKFVSEYQTQMTDMMNAANDVMTTAQKSVAATSTDSSVVSAEIKSKYASRTEHTVDVQQIATAQTNISNAVSGSASNSMTGTLEIRTSERESPITVSMDSFSGAKTNRDALAAAAKEINSGKDSGVTARVIDNKDGTSALEITSADTGEKGAFLVGGSFAQSSGLEQTRQTAQNAVYSVDGGESKTSSGNTINLDGFRVEATLKKEGKATVRIGADNEKTADSVQTLVDTYNKALSFLNDNADMGSGVLREMKNMLTMSLSEDSMKKVGVTSNKDGTLSFDRSTYREAAKRDSSFANNLVGGSYSIANGIYNDAKSGLSIPSRSLVDNARNASNQSNGINSWLNYGGRYSSTTYGNFMNYSSSLSLLNMLI